MKSAHLRVSAGQRKMRLLRGLTEERYLLRDLDYQDYARRVKYRFIPGLI